MPSMRPVLVFQLVCEGTSQWRIGVVGKAKKSVIVGVAVLKDAEAEREGKKRLAWMGIKRFNGVAGNKRVGLEPMVAVKETTDG